MNLSWKHWVDVHLHTTSFEVCVCVCWRGLSAVTTPPLHMNRAEPCAVDSCLLWTVQRQKALNPVTSLFHVFIWYHSSSPYCRSIQLCSLGLQLATTLHSSPGVPHLVPLNEMEEGKKSFWKDSVQLSLTFVWRQNVGSFKTCFHSWGLITLTCVHSETYCQNFTSLSYITTSQD